MNKAQLRASAEALGIPAKEIRAAGSVEELQALILETMNGGATTTTTRKRTPKRATVKRTTVKRTTAKRTTARKSASSKPKPAAQSTTRGKAKRSAAASNGSGRMLLGDVDFSKTGDWNPRPGSAPDIIAKALKRFKGNRAKVFNFLLPDMFKKNLVNRNFANGTPRSQESAEDMLKYRISRTAWDFAMKTDQHTKSENRVEYGTQGTFEAIKTKPARSPQSVKPVRKSRKATTAKTTTATRGRPRKAAAASTEAPKRRPGRPRKAASATTTTKPVAKKKKAARR